MPNFTYKGRHKNATSSREFTAVLKTWKKRKWQKSISMMDDLFLKYPMYHAPLIGNYTHAMKMYTEKVVQSLVDIRNTLPRYEKDPMKMWISQTLQTQSINKNILKSVDQYFKKWILTIKMSRKHDAKVYKNNYNKLFNEAYQAYISFLLSTKNKNKAIKYMFKYSPDIKTNLYHTLCCLHFCVTNSKLSDGLKFVGKICGILLNKYINITDAFLIHMMYYHSYILLRMQKYQKAKECWNQIENKFDYECIRNVLFENKMKDRTLQKIKQNSMLFLRNTSVYDLKMRFYIGLEEFDKAEEVQWFFYNLWGHEDQVHCYKAFLEFKKQQRPAWALHLFDSVITDCQVKKNQHYFCGLFYLDLKDYEHAKYHFLSCIVDIDYYKWDIIVAEHYFYLSVTLLELKEYKLSKYYLDIAHMLTPESPVIEQRFCQMTIFLNQALNLLECANTRCHKKYYYYTAGKKLKTLSVCKGCGKSYYCSRLCQKKHWKIHKKKCDESWIVCFKMLKERTYISCPHHTNTKQMIKHMH